jgi:hypothetical protein
LIFALDCIGRCAKCRNRTTLSRAVVKHRKTSGTSDRTDVKPTSAGRRTQPPLGSRC